MPKQQPYTDDQLAALGLRRDSLPRHVAVIMDGNGRWAQQRGLPRVEGHRQGTRSVRAVVEECCRLGLDQLTLYCLSVENWKRPQQELDFLMGRHAVRSVYAVDNILDLKYFDTLLADLAARPRPPRLFYETKANLTRPITPRTGRVRVEGRVVSQGRQIISCEASVCDREGRVLAHGTSTLMVLAAK